MKEDLLVSTVIPTYNRGEVLLKAINSVLNQTYENWELLIVDDGSTDNTEEIVKSFNDTRITYLQNSRTKGAQGARNTGIQDAKGKWIAFLDSDDIWFPEKLEMQVKIIESDPKVDFIYTGQISVLPDGTTKAIYREQKEDYQKALLKSNCIGGYPHVLIRRKCLIEVGLLDESLPAKQDHEFWLRLVQNPCKIRCISEPLIIAQGPDFSDDKRVYNVSNKIEGMVTILKKHKKLYKTNKTRYGVALLSTSKLMFRTLDWRFFPFFVKGIWYTNTYILTYLFKELCQKIKAFNK